MKVCSAVQLSGFCMCLLGAARITHRAQRVVSIASRWHMLMSCNSDNKHCTSERLIFHDEHGDEEPRLISEPASLEQSHPCASFWQCQALGRWSLLSPINGAQMMLNISHVPILCWCSDLFATQWGWDHTVRFHAGPWVAAYLVRIWNHLGAVDP